MQRWKLLLEELDYGLRPKSGTENIAADHLSRSWLIRLNLKRKKHEKLREVIEDEVKINKILIEVHEKHCISVFLIPGNYWSLLRR